jgi:effector-binding domain-containing protein
MLDTPQVILLPAQHTAVVHLKVPRAQLESIVPTAIEVVLAALAQRGVEPTGPLFMHHLHEPDAEIDFELGFPVAQPFEAVENVVPSSLPATRAITAVHQGSYQALSASWSELHDWLKQQAGLVPAAHVWESYAVGPESGLSLEEWRTDLIQPLLD